MSFISDRQPFDPSRCRIYYGWPILAFASIGVLASIPGQTMGVSVFTDSLMEVLKLSRVQISTAYMIGTTLSALLLPRIGKLYDRIGSRRMATWTACLLGTTLLILSTIDHLVNALTGLFGSAFHAIVAFSLMTCGFLALRCLGQGTMTMVSRNMAMKWFVQKRGLANALMGVVIAFGFSYATFGLNILVENFTWRGAWVLLGFIIGVVFSIFALIFFRDDPRALGLEPDGGLASSDETKKVELEHDLPYAKSTYEFWIYTLSLSTIGVLNTAMTFHVVSIFTEADFTRSEAIGIFVPIAAVATCTSLIGSWASDYIRLKYHLFIFNVGIVLISLGLVSLDQWYGILLCMLGTGLGSGMFGVLSTLTWPRMFGIKHLGAITGYAMSWIVFGSAVGPMLFSLSLDIWDTYDVAVALCGAAGVILGIGTLFSRE